MKSANNTNEEQRITLEDTRGHVPQDFPREVWEDLGFQLEPMKAIRAKCLDGCPIHDSLLIGLTVPGADKTAIAAMAEAWAAHSARWAKAMGGFVHGQ